MSDFHDTPTYRIARKRHRCAACWHFIERGEKYVQQSGFYDGRAYRNRFHAECRDVLEEEARASGNFEFIPGALAPPERVRAAIAQAMPAAQGERG